MGTLTRSDGKVTCSKVSGAPTAPSASERRRIRSLELPSASERRRIRIIELPSASERRRMHITQLPSVSGRHRIHVLELPSVSPRWKAREFHAYQLSPCPHPAQFSPDHFTSSCQSTQFLSKELGGSA